MVKKLKINKKGLQWWINFYNAPQKVNPDSIAYYQKRYHNENGVVMQMAMLGRSYEEAFKIWEEEINL